MAETMAHPLEYRLRRSTIDKHAEVLALLCDAWCRRSDREVARRCGVDHKSVAIWRKQLADAMSQMEDTEPSLWPLLTPDLLYQAGISPAAIQRLMARLQALPPDKRQEAARWLQALLL